MSLDTKSLYFDVQLTLLQCSFLFLYVLQRVSDENNIYLETLIIKMN